MCNVKQAHANLPHNITELNESQSQVEEINLFFSHSLLPVMLWITLQYKWTKIAKTLFVCQVTGSIKSWQYNDCGVKFIGDKRARGTLCWRHSKLWFSIPKLSVCTRAAQQNNSKKQLKRFARLPSTMLAVNRYSEKINICRKVQISDEEEPSLSYCICVTEVRHGQTLMSSLRTLGKICTCTGQCLTMQ